MKSKRLLKKTKHIDVNIKFPKEKIEHYPFVEVHWLDIVGETGWQTFEQLKKSQLGRMISRGWMVSRAKGVTRIFADYGLKDGRDGDEGHIETIGGTTIIPNSVITKIVRL
jgi:hypothetical protein